MAPRGPENATMVLTRLRILSPVEEADSHTGTHDADGAPMTIPALLERSRRDWGSKIAFQQKIHREWTRYSHEDIYERSHDLAAGLLGLGVAPGDRVALVLENSIEWICSYYAIVLTGAIAVPMYYELKPEEIEAMLEHTDAKIGIASAKVLPKLGTALSRLETLITVGETSTPLAGSNPIVPDQLRRQREPERLDLDELPRRATDDAGTAAAAQRATGRPRVDRLHVRHDRRHEGRDADAPQLHGELRSIRALHPVQRARPHRHGAADAPRVPLHRRLAVAPAVGGELTFENDLRRIRDRMAEVKPTLFLGVPALFEVMYRNIVHGIEAQGRLETFERGLRIVEATKQRTGINIGRIVFRELHKRLGGSLRFMVSGGAALNPQVARNFARLGVPIIQGWGLTEVGAGAHRAALEPAQVLHVELLRRALRHRRPAARRRRDRPHRRAREGAVRAPARRGRARRARRQHHARLLAVGRRD